MPALYALSHLLGDGDFHFHDFRFDLASTNFFINFLHKVLKFPIKLQMVKSINFNGEIIQGQFDPLEILDLAFFRIVLRS